MLDTMNLMIGHATGIFHHGADGLRAYATEIDGINEEIIDITVP
jgi:hypothetical protein